MIAGETGETDAAEERGFHFERLKWKRPYRYVWLKHVVGIDLSVHCARSLVGRYDGRIDALCLDHLPFAVANDAPVMYLCAVSVYADNVHIPFRFALGKRLEVEDENCAVRIRNAEYLPLGVPVVASGCDWRQFIIARHPKARLASYATCRNWQFACWLARNPAVLEARRE